MCRSDCAAHAPAPEGGPVVFVVGPTAAGKTALAVDLARRFGGEIINVDSRQFYRGMDIGTAKPTPAERVAAVHHLVDVADPDETLSLGWFLDLAHAAIRDIRARGRLPLIAGGTGQYVRALLEDWDVPRVPPDPDLRARLEARIVGEGLDALVAQLDALDPARSAAIDRRNPRRVVRALEVALAGGGRDQPPPERERLDRRLVLGIALDRSVLFERIDARVDAMFAAGFVEEVRSLVARGHGCDAPAFSAIGYREVCGFLRGDLTLDEARARVKTATHRLARTQDGWFRRSDPRITWLEAGTDLTERAAAAVRAFLDAEPEE